MIRAAGKDDAAFLILFHVLYGLFPFFSDILSGMPQFFPRGAGSVYDLLGRKLGKFFDKGFRSGLDIPEGHKWIPQHGFAPADFLHIVFNIFRVGGDNRAVVMIVGRLEFIAFIKERGVEDKVHAFMNEPAHMSVGELGRVTFGFAWDRFDAKRIDVMVGKRRKYDLISESGEKSEPERVILVHIQYPGDTDSPSFCHVRGERFVSEDSF